MDPFLHQSISPMLIGEMQQPFNDENYIYELKLDGIRCLAYMDKNQVKFINKRRKILNQYIPELSEIYKNVNNRCILDGELLILKNGVPDFFLIQSRVLTNDPFKLELASKKYPASFVAYDILYLKDKEIVDLELMDRKRLLEETVVEDERLAISRYIKNKGIELFELAKQQQLEGVIAKQKKSKYYYGKRTKEWIKFKFLLDEDFVICGYIIKEKNMTSLILGQYTDKILHYKGHVTLGVSLNNLLSYQVKQIAIPEFEFPSGNEDAVWLEPKLVCIVQYMPNEKNSLRQPVFKGIRDDKMPLECQNSVK